MAEKITLHQEICDILVSKGNNWTSTYELASLVNQRGRYRKRDGTTVSDFQIHGRTRNYQESFERDGNLVRCRAENVCMIKIQSTKQNLMKFAVKPLAQLLIDAAKRRSFITYGEAKQLLETEAGFDTIFTPMVGFPAGVLNDRFLATRRDCPPLSILLVGQKDHLPGVGAGNFMAKHLQWNELSNRDFKVNRPEEWRSACDRIATDIYKFRDWEQVYRKAFGEFLPTFPSSRSTKSKEKDGVKYKRKGEGKNHKDLRLWVKCNPGKINSTYASFDTETEFRLDSGDRVDVVYFGQDLTVAIEVKSKDSDDSDIRRGVFQCIKYRAVLQAMDMRSCINVVAILVTQKDVTGYLKALLSKHNIRSFKAAKTLTENFKPTSMKKRKS